MQSDKTLTYMKLIMADVIICGAVSILIAMIWHSPWAYLPIAIGSILLIILWAKGLDNIWNTNKEK
jgi:hypothetical protein